MNSNSRSTRRTVLKEIALNRSIAKPDIGKQQEALLERVRKVAAETDQLCEDLKTTLNLEQRWISLGATDLQKGFMSLARGITKQPNF